jgi:hypothetical protein
MTPTTAPRRSIPRRLAPLALLPAAVCLAVGCESSRLETGYQPRPLNSSDTERRAYYSSRYSREAIIAEQSRETDYRDRRPTRPRY